MPHPQPHSQSYPDRQASQDEATAFARQLWDTHGSRHMSPFARARFETVMVERLTAVEAASPHQLALAVDEAARQLATMRDPAAALYKALDKLDAQCVRDLVKQASAQQASSQQPLTGASPGPDAEQRREARSEDILARIRLAMGRPRPPITEALAAGSSKVMDDWLAAAAAWDEEYGAEAAAAHEALVGQAREMQAAGEPVPQITRWLYEAADTCTVGREARA